MQASSDSLTDFGSRRVMVLSEISDVLRAFKKIAPSIPVPVDERIIATTNADLLERFDEKTFRHGLYDRLNAKIPPLLYRADGILLAGRKAGRITNERTFWQDV